MKAKRCCRPCRPHLQKPVRSSTDLAAELDGLLLDLFRLPQDFIDLGEALRRL